MPLLSRPSSVSTSSHLIGHHVEEVVVHAAAVHPLSGRHRASNLLFLGYRHSAFGHTLPGQTGLGQRWDFHIFKGAKTKLPLSVLLRKWVKRKVELKVQRLGASVSSLCWIKREFSPAGLAAAKAVGMRTVSAAFRPPSLENRLFCCPHPACFGSLTLVGAARKEGEVVLVNARRPPPPTSCPTRSD